MKMKDLAGRLFQKVGDGERNGKRAGETLPPM